MTERGYAGHQHNGYALTLIVAGHAAALTALAMYKMEYTRVPPNIGIVTENIAIEPPPPVEPPPPPERTVEARPAQDRSVITTVPPIIPTPNRGPVVEPAPNEKVIFNPGPVGTLDLTGTTIVSDPPIVEDPIVLPRLKPVGAKPRGNPSGWVTNDDYPDSALRNEEQGRTAFRLAIATDGRPTSCTITASSGARALDDAACRLLMRRARFVSARDGAGNATAGTYANSFLWQIPAD